MPIYQTQQNYLIVLYILCAFNSILNSKTQLSIDKMCNLYALK